MQDWIYLSKHQPKQYTEKTTEEDKEKANEPLKPSILTNEF